MLSFVINCRSDFQSVCIILHSRQHWMRVPVGPHSRWHSVSLVFGIFSILIGVWWYLLGDLTVPHSKLDNNCSYLYVLIRGFNMTNRTNHLREYLTLHDCFMNIGIGNVLHGNFVTLSVPAKSKSFMIWLCALSPSLPGNICTSYSYQPSPAFVEARPSAWSVSSSVCFVVSLL